MAMAATATATAALATAAATGAWDATCLKLLGFFFCFYYCYTNVFI